MALSPRVSRCHWLPVEFDANSNRSYDYLVVVTFDTAKDAKNIREHGISLRRAEDFDFDAACFDVDDREDYGEVRWNAIGFLDARLYSLTFTEVEDGIIRAISLRKASTSEGKRYEQA